MARFLDVELPPNLLPASAVHVDVGQQVAGLGDPAMLGEMPA
jgi:hypothetical protein